MMQTYFIQAANGEGPIKIGKSTDVAGRLSTLQVGSPTPLRLLGTIDADHEDELHQRFARHRSHGEWYNPALDVRDYLKQALGVEVRGPQVHLVETLRRGSSKRPGGGVWLAKRKLKSGKTSYHMRWIAGGRWNSRAVGTSRPRAERLAFVLASELAESHSGRGDVVAAKVG